MWPFCLTGRMSFEPAESDDSFFVSQKALKAQKYLSCRGLFSFCGFCDFREYYFSR